jgi:predicted nucleotidyltransferase
LSTVSITYFAREAVRRALDEYVQTLAACHPELEEVILFGSLVHGTPVPGSDVDLLLVLSTSDRPFPGRIPEFLPTRFPVGVDLFPYTRDELERMQAQGNPLVLGALREGVVLFRRGDG